MRKCVCAMPNIPPIIDLNPATSVRNEILFGPNVNDSTAKGASFCHVDRIKHVGHEADVITEGYQK